MKIGTNLVFDPPETIIEKCVLADKNGFDQISLCDHAMTMSPTTDVCWDAYAMLSYLAPLTKKVGLGTGVTDALRRHPSSVAQSFATLDYLSGGRAILGIGAGEAQNLTPFGIEFDKPLERFREALVVIGSLLAASPENPMSFAGRYFTLNDAFLQVRAIQKPRPPIYVGAIGPKLRELTGELADGWVSWIVTRDLFKKRVEDVRRGEEKAKKRSGSTKLILVLPTAVSSDSSAARRAVEMQCRGALILESNVLKSLGYDTSQLSAETRLLNCMPTPSQVKRFAKLVQELPKEVVEKCIDEYAAAGTVSEVIEKLDSFRKVGVDVALVQMFGNHKDGFESYGKQIIPQFEP